MTVTTRPQQTSIITSNNHGMFESELNHELLRLYKEEKQVLVIQFSTDTVYEPTYNTTRTFYHALIIYFIEADDHGK